MTVACSIVHIPGSAWIDHLPVSEYWRSRLRTDDCAWMRTIAPAFRHLRLHAHDCSAAGELRDFSCVAGQNHASQVLRGLPQRVHGSLMIAL